MTLLLSQEQVKSLLNMNEVIVAIDQVQRMFSREQVVMPVRLTTAIPAHDAEHMLMPAWLGSGQGFGFKSVNIFPRNAGKRLPPLLAMVVLLNPETGQLLAIMDATYLTTIRTAAASAVATRALARPDATVLALVGAGEQAKSHLLAMRAVRPVSTVRVAATSRAHAKAFVDRVRETHPDVRIYAVDTAEEAVRGADIVCTVTNSATPVLAYEWLKAGCHINAVGSHSPSTREVDSRTVTAARVVVDSRDACLTECGDLLVPLSEGIFAADHVSDEIGEILDDDKPGRNSLDEITLYESTGLAVQDIVTANLVYLKAVSTGIGSQIDV